ncbi:MAG: sugar-transfer associated ATP-grasp domain-containing protein [Ruminococcus sp.]|nr:sugar-transfer associated ATP-grasp domain-containing protein [Ruminococcus sp.]
MAEKGYIFKVLAHASFGKMKTAIKAVHEKSGKNSIKIFFDMLWCAKRYGAGYYDYQIFAFYNLNKEQRKTFVTRLISKKFNTFMNNYDYAHFLENKDEFNELYKDYIGREFIKLESATKDEVKKFLSTKEYVFCKLQDKECGIGCERIKVSDYETLDDLYDYLTEKGFCTIEENIVQHPAMSKLYSNAVNSMRIITVLDAQKVAHCVYIVQKMGLGGSVIDNNCLFTPVDIETGKIKFPAHSGDTTKGIIYEEHPDTHVKLQGYQLPFVKEAVEMCLKAATVVPEIRYVGWDVAITPNGPAIIEGNTYCAHDFWQLPPHTPDKIGMLPTLKKYIPEFEY